jgi:hypothetical protein
MATTPTPSPSTTTFANVNPVANAVNTQGDLPIYALPGPSNIVYGATYASSLARGGTPDVVGWSYNAPLGGTGLAGLNTLTQIAGQGGITYYTLPGFLEQWGQLAPDQRTTIQKQLLAAGLYSSSYYPSAAGTTAKQPLYGAAADYDTITALTNAWDAAKSTGQTMDTVLGQANAAAMNAAKIYQQNTMVGIFDQSDPAEIRGIADQQAIATLGRKATADEKALAVSMVQAAQVAQQQGKFNQQVAANRSDVATQLAGGIGGTQGAVPSSIAANSPASVNALVSALGGQESGSPTAGGYTAVNPDSGATGRFQIMPGNWASWSQAAGLGPNARMDAQNQEIVARNQISIYLADGGGDPSYVAVAWYAGEGTAKAFQADPTNPKWKQPQGKYPSIYSYAQSIVGKIGAATPGTLAAQAAAGAPPIPPVGGPGGPANAGSINVGQGRAATSLAGEVGSINVGQRPTGAIPTAGASLAGEVGSIGVTPGAPGASGLTGVNTGATMTTGAGGLPTPAQLIPTSTGVYTQVNPQADVAEMLRKQNPLGASAHDFEQILDAIRQMFARGS